MARRNLSDLMTVDDEGLMSTCIINDSANRDTLNYLNCR
jgi:hypothetical protein